MPQPDRKRFGERFLEVLHAFTPEKINGVWNPAESVVAFAARLGRDLTPDEIGVVRELIIEAAVLDGLKREYEEIPGHPE